MQKIILLLLFVSVHFQANAQTKVQIGDLYYNLSGVTASVAPYMRYSENLYKNDKYTVPDTITYNGLTYTVKGIDERAFGSYIIGGYHGTTASQINLPNTLETIGEEAFSYCRNLVHIIIPKSVKSFTGRSFSGCDFLRTIIYLPTNAPEKWTATTYTYVPDKQSYSSPTFKINDANIIEMISFGDSVFTYTGQSPTTTWTNNVEGYTASLTMPTLKKDAGSYTEEIPVTFTKDDESFTANVIYRYTIKQAHLTAKVENASKEYGENNPHFNITYLSPL